jgi:hypothetical protein
VYRCPAWSLAATVYTRRVKKLLYFLVALVIAFLVLYSPHWHFLNIHDVTAFRVVLSLGAFQTIVAIYGGWLAVLALPEKDQAGREFRFAVLGVALFGLTFWLGILNDRTQYELQSSLNNSTTVLTNISAALGKPCDQRTIDKIQTYIAGVIRSNSNRSAPPPPPLVVQPVLVPSTAPQPMLTTPAVIASRLDDYAMRVQRIGSQDPDRRQESYNRWHESERRALFGTTLPSDPPLTPEQKEKDDKGYNAEMLLFNAQDVAAYTAIDADIRQALSDAYVALNFSEAKKARELATFDGLSAGAKKSIPTSSNGASPYDEDYAKIAVYINGIRDQLASIKK